MQALMLFNVLLTVFACFFLWWRGRVKKFQATVKLVDEACRKGEYERGLHLAEDLKKQRRTIPPAYWFLRGKLLYQLGRLPDAESCFRTELTLEADSRRKALAREALGRVLMEEKRYDAAIASFEASAEDCSDLGIGHCGIAEAYLRQGIRAADALGSARLAVEIARAARARHKQLQDMDLAEAMATLAWAVAAHSADASEVDRLVADAFPLCSEEYKPIQAHLHFLAGGAYSALGGRGAREKSADYFQQAAAADPQGNFGRLAKAAETTV